MYGNNKRLRVVFDSEEAKNAAFNSLVLRLNGVSQQAYQAEKVIFFRLENFGTFELYYNDSLLWQVELVNPSPSQQIVSMSFELPISGGDLNGNSINMQLPVSGADCVEHLKLTESGGQQFTVRYDSDTEAYRITDGYDNFNPLECNNSVITFGQEPAGPNFTYTAIEWV